TVTTFTSASTAGTGALKNGTHDNASFVKIQAAAASTDSRPFLGWTLNNTAVGSGSTVCAAVPAGGNVNYLANYGAPVPTDTTAPTVTVTTPTVPAGQNGFFKASNVPVTVSVSATDSSGVTNLSCTDGANPVTVNNQTGSSPRTGSFQLSA